MTILTGEQIVCETISQFFERTSFELSDVLEAIDRSDTVDMSRCDKSKLKDIGDYHQEFADS